MSIACTHAECRTRYDCQYVGHHASLHGPFEVYQSGPEWYWWDGEAEPVGPFINSVEAYLDATRLERLC